MTHEIKAYVRHMRSSKSRSRSKSNRNRPNGVNVVNRVFDSSGPEGKVRGTPQQIIDKYNQLTRDAQLSNDRVAAENFQQHAEHYLRLLNEAQREIDARREDQERQNRERQADRDRERAERLERQEREATANQAAQQKSRHQPQSQQLQTQQSQPGPAHAETEGDAAENPAVSHPDPASAPQPEVIDPRDSANGNTQDSGLVETPESKSDEPAAVKKPAARKPRSRKPAAAKPAAEGDAVAAEGETPATEEVAKEAKPKRAPRARKPKPKAEDAPEAAE